MTETLTVGGFEIGVDYARDLADAYMNQYGKWSYPVYDSYAGSGKPDTVELQDTLAVALLNAGQNPVTTQYTFVDLLEDINTRLGDKRLSGSLAEASDSTLEAIAELFGVLDRTDPTPGVRLTKLSKVLHLKRPDLIPLYDNNIWRCYAKLGNPRVEPVKGRSWKDFALAWLPAVRQDLRDGLQHWQGMASLAPEDGPVPTPLRVLDMVAWRHVEKVAPRRAKEKLSDE
jgi:hypothetical protein